MLTSRPQYEKPQISILIMHSYVWVIPITLFLSSHLARPVRREYFYWEKQVTLKQADQLVPVCPGLFHFLTPNVPCPGNLFSPEHIRVVSHSAMDHGAFDVLKQAFVCPHGGRQTGIKWASISQTASSFLREASRLPYHLLEPRRIQPSSGKTTKFGNNLGVLYILPQFLQPLFEEVT